MARRQSHGLVDPLSSGQRKSLPVNQFMPALSAPFDKVLAIPGGRRVDLADRLIAARPASGPSSPDPFPATEGRQGALKAHGLGWRPPIPK